jgi:hypothetical protein
VEAETTTIDLADAIDALAEACDPGTASLTEHDGTLHVYVTSVTAWGAFCAALAVRLAGDGASLVHTPGEVAAIMRAARTTWDDRLADRGWMDGGVLGGWFPGVTIIQARVSPADLAAGHLIDAATAVHWDDTGWTECRACLNLGPLGGPPSTERTGRVITEPGWSCDSEAEVNR